MGLSYKGIELTSSKASFASSVVLAAINPEYATKDADYFSVLNDFAIDNEKSVEFGEIISLYQNLNGLLNLTYQIRNGGIAQYFFNGYNSGHSSLESVQSFLKGEFTDFVHEVFGMSGEEIQHTKNLIELFSVVQRVIQEKNIDEFGRWKTTEFETCSECDGSGRVTREDDEGEEVEEYCDDCHGRGEIEVDVEEEFNFNDITVSKLGLDGFDVDQVFYSNDSEIDLVVELMSEYLVKEDRLETRQEMER